MISTALLTSFGTISNGANTSKATIDCIIISLSLRPLPRILAAKLLAPKTSPTIG